MKTKSAHAQLRDRQAWLEAQEWTLRYTGCSCFDKIQECDHIKWFFGGIAFFTAVTRAPLHSDAYICFSVHKRRDSCQLIVTIGLWKPTPQSASMVVMRFGRYPPFVINLHQVQKVTLWNRTQGCKLCKEMDILKKKKCRCRRLPSLLTLRFKYVALHVYMSRRNDPQGLCVSRLSDHVLNAINSTEPFPDNTTTVVLRSGASLEKVLACSKELSKQQNRDYESFCTSATLASKVCTIDPDWMNRLLLSLAQSSMKMRRKKQQARLLKESLNIFLKEVQDEEALIIEKEAELLSNVQQLTLARSKIAKITEVLMDLDIITS